MRLLVASSLALTVALVGRSASAYCYTSTCKEVGICDGAAEPDGECRPLRWRTGCTGFTVQEDGSQKLDLDLGTVGDVMERAFAAWAEADCGGAPPGFVVTAMGSVTCEAAEYNKDAGNTNVLVFRDGEWPNPDTGHNIALTTTTFDPETGELLDADIEVNSSTYNLTTSDTSVDFDLLSVLTHEAGHFLGMGHSSLPEATMYATYEGSTLDLRTLDGDDVAGICTLYPPKNMPDQGCNPLQRHGFSPYCHDDQPEGSCAVAGGLAGPSSEVTGPAWLGVLGLAAALRRVMARVQGSR